MSDQSQEQRKFLSVKQGAEMALVSLRFIYSRIGKEDGPPFLRRGKKIMLPKDEFAEWARKQIIS